MCVSVCLWFFEARFCTLCPDRLIGPCWSVHVTWRVAVVSLVVVDVSIWWDSFTVQWQCVLVAVGSSYMSSLISTTLAEVSHCNCNSNSNWGTCIAPPTRRPRAHHRVNPYPGAHRQNEAEMFSDHDKTSPSIAAVSAPSRAVLSNGPAGPGPRAPSLRGPPNSPCYFSSREIIVTNCVIFHWINW